MSMDDIKCYIVVIRGMKRLSCYLHLCCLKVSCGSVVGFVFNNIYPSVALVFQSGFYVPSLAIRGFRFLCRTVKKILN